MNPDSTRCCVAGGGPAGLMLGLLLARRGVDVIVLEKHADFLRDFRGDTLHPSTLEVIRELGWLDELLALPHQQVEQLTAVFGGRSVTLADFRTLSTTCRFIAFMPQWDFLDFLARKASAYPGFDLRMRTEATGLIESDGRIAGVRATGPGGTLEIRADLVVAGDGRGSVLRDAAGFVPEELGAPMDVVWFRLDSADEARGEPLARFGSGRILVMLPRGDYWQCGYVIPKGGNDVLRERGFDAFRAEVAELRPGLREALGRLSGWDAVSLLTVRVNRLSRWCRSGLLCIGDAAHAMSPVGGVGINLAIQDAVAAANLLADALKGGAPPAVDLLERVQARRERPTRLTQRLQLLMQNRVISEVLATRGEPRPPLPLRIIDAVPWLRRFPARLIGIGVQPEHVAPAASPGH